VSVLLEFLLKFSVVVDVATWAFDFKLEVGVAGESAKVFELTSCRTPSPFAFVLQPVFVFRPNAKCDFEVARLARKIWTVASHLW
jgi:hypothetical protein